MSVRNVEQTVTIRDAKSRIPWTELSETSNRLLYYAMQNPEYCGLNNTLRGDMRTNLYGKFGSARWAPCGAVLGSNLQGKNHVALFSFTAHLVVYTGCPRRNVPDFERVFIMLKYNDITQNAYVQS